MLFCKFPVDFGVAAVQGKCISYKDKFFYIAFDLTSVNLTSRGSHQAWILVSLLSFFSLFSCRDFRVDGVYFAFLLSAPMCCHR